MDEKTSFIPPLFDYLSHIKRLLPLLVKAINKDLYPMKHKIKVLLTTLSCQQSRESKLCNDDFAVKATPL
ncbi:hypothetical protein CU635_10840 [Bacillus canaveralius]|uniref:Uncharacterized protein n=1 Tax=Bacillus canaveralius TaxID=1403243 RepID=A0A2N5GMB4_9BACI|nr:hypothetical protein CU635_10840 [Bacillus canaveralius]